MIYCKQVERFDYIVDSFCFIWEVRLLEGGLKEGCEVVEILWVVGNVYTW